MKSQDPNNPSVSIPLQTLIYDLLGNAHYVTISFDTAVAILLHAKNEHSVHVQMPSDKDNVDILGQNLTHPLLWNIQHWRTSSERHLRAKARARREKEERDILEANIRVVGKAILRMAAVDYDAAFVIARQLIVKGDLVRIELLGVKKLYTSVKEL